MRPVSEGSGKQCQTGSPNNFLRFSGPAGASLSNSWLRLVSILTASFADPIKGFQLSKPTASANQWKDKMGLSCIDDNANNGYYETRVQTQHSQLIMYAATKQSKGAAALMVQRQWYMQTSTSSIAVLYSTVCKAMLTGAYSLLKVHI
jgi:hypothetical protein